MSLPSGTQVGAYTIESLIGSGGMGEVYRAKDDRLGRTVAIKLLHSSRQTSPDARNRFLQEARLVSSLQHPNIVTLFDIGKQGDFDYLVFEYCSGKTLAQIIGTKGVRLDETLRIAVAVADAIAKAHAAGVLHRDLKPGNIVVAEDGTVKVLDFGLAKLAMAAAAAADGSTHTIATEPLSREGTVVGTPGYMSPEQAEGRPLDARSDIFSFGAVLYEMLTGRRAFQGDSTASVLAAILREDPPAPASLNRNVPREVERIVQRCLRKDADRRFQNMADVRVELQELKDEWDSGTLSSASTAAVSPTRNRRRWPLLATAALVSVGIAGVIYLSGREEAAEPEMTAVAFASHPGDERDPTFSPDGTQVAFCWAAEDGNGLDLYVQLVGSTGKPIRITNTPNETEIVPQWSPDGRWIAFAGVRNAAPAIVMAPALGGPERVILPLPGTTWFSWTPDSRGIVAAIRPNGELAVVSVEDGSVRKILSPAKKDVRYFGPAVSPDGKRLAFQHREGEDVFLAYVELTGNHDPAGPPKLIATEHRQVEWPLWTNDSKEVVFINGPRNSTSAMWRVNPSTGKVRRVAIAGDGAWVASIARRGQRMAFTRLQEDDNLARVELGMDTAGRESPTEQVLASTQMDASPVYSPDGSKIAFASARSGSSEIWVAPVSGGDATTLTSMGGQHTAQPEWSPSGDTIAFHSRGDGRLPTGIYLMPSTGGKPRRITPPGLSAFAPRWSRDGKFVYYNGLISAAGAATWKISAAGGEPVQVAEPGYSSCKDGPDGAFYCINQSRQIVRRASSGDSTVSDLKDVNMLAVSGSSIYALTGRQRDLQVFRIDPTSGRSRQIGLITKAMRMGFSVSPDEKFLVYTRREHSSSDLMLVEGFR